MKTNNLKKYRKNSHIYISSGARKGFSATLFSVNMIIFYPRKLYTDNYLKSVLRVEREIIEGIFLFIIKIPIIILSMIVYKNDLLSEKEQLKNR